VALGRRRRGRLRGRPGPQPRSSGEGIPYPITAVAVRLPIRRRLAAAAVPAVASLETRSLLRPRLAASRGEDSRRRGGVRGPRPHRYPRRGTYRGRRYERHR
jgi:hypothetical protein